MAKPKRGGRAQPAGKRAKAGRPPDSGDAPSDLGRAGETLGEVLGNALREARKGNPSKDADHTLEFDVSRAERDALIKRYGGQVDQQNVQARQSRKAQGLLGGQSFESDLRGFERFGLRHWILYDPDTATSPRHDEVRRTYRAMMFALAHVRRQESGERCDDERPCLYRRAFETLAKWGAHDRWAAGEYALDDWRNVEPFLAARLRPPPEWRAEWTAQQRHRIEDWTAAKALRVGREVRGEVEKFNADLNKRRLEPARRDLVKPRWTLEYVLLGMVATSWDDLVFRVADADHVAEARALEAFWCDPSTDDVGNWNGPVDALAEMLQRGEVAARGVNRDGRTMDVPADDWAHLFILRGERGEGPHAAICSPNHAEHIWGSALPGGDRWTQLSFDSRQVEAALRARGFAAFSKLVAPREPYREALAWLHDPDRKLWPLEVALAFVRARTFGQFGLAVADPAELVWLRALGEGYKRGPNETAITIPGGERTITTRQKHLLDALGKLFDDIVSGEVGASGRFNDSELRPILKEDIRLLGASWGLLDGKVSRIPSALRILSGASIAGVLDVRNISHRGAPYLAECDVCEHIWGTPKHGGRVWTDLHIARETLVLASPKLDLPEPERSWAGVRRKLFPKPAPKPTPTVRGGGARLSGSRSTRSRALLAGTPPASNATSASPQLTDEPKPGEPASVRSARAGDLPRDIVKAHIGEHGDKGGDAPAVLAAVNAELGVNRGTKFRWKVSARTVHRALARRPAQA